MKLNLDSLKKDLIVRTPSPAPVSQQSGMSSDNIPSNKEQQAVQEVSTKSGILKLVSLSSPADVQKESTIKLVSLEELKKKKAEKDLEKLAGEHEDSEQRALHGEAFMTLDQKILKEEGPVFKNLNKETHIVWEAQKLIYEKYRKARRKKITYYTAYPLAAIFFFSLIASVVVPKNFQQASVAPNSRNTNGISVHSSANTNGFTTNMNSSGTGSVMMAYATGDAYVAMVESKGNLRPDIKANIENLFKGSSTVLTLEAVRWWMIANDITILQPRDPRVPRDAYVIKFALQHNIIIDEGEIHEYLQQAQLGYFILAEKGLNTEEKIAEIEKTKSDDMKKIGLADKAIDAYVDVLPGNAAQQNNTNKNTTIDALMENQNSNHIPKIPTEKGTSKLVTITNGNSNSMTVPHGVTITDAVAGVTLIDVVSKKFTISDTSLRVFEEYFQQKETVTVADGLEQTMKLLHIPMLIPRTNTAEPYLISFAIKKGIITSKNQFGASLNYEMLINMVDIFQRKRL